MYANIIRVKSYTLDPDTIKTIEDVKAILVGLDIRVGVEYAEEHGIKKYLKEYTDSAQ